MTDERVFTVAEAEALLPDLRIRLARIREARAVVITTSSVVTGRVADDGGGVSTDPGYFEASRTLRTELKHLADEGVVLRDPERGLVDFLGEVEGRRVWLCWHMGEEHVTHYHELESGFAGRKPL